MQAWYPAVGWEATVSPTSVTQGFILYIGDNTPAHSAGVLRPSGVNTPAPVEAQCPCLSWNICTLCEDVLPVTGIIKS